MPGKLDSAPIDQRDVLILLMEQAAEVSNSVPSEVFSLISPLEPSNKEVLPIKKA